MDIESALEQAASATLQGNKPRARFILASLIMREPHNELAWLLLAEAVEDKERAAYCYERALRLNPTSGVAHGGLAKLRGIASPPIPPQTPPTVEPVAKIIPKEHTTDLPERGLRLNPGNERARRRLEELKQGQSPASGTALMLVQASVKASRHTRFLRT